MFEFIPKVKCARRICFPLFSATHCLSYSTEVDSHIITRSTHARVIHVSQKIQPGFVPLRYTAKALSAVIPPTLNILFARGSQSQDSWLTGTASGWTEEGCTTINKDYYELWTMQSYSRIKDQTVKESPLKTCCSTSSWYESAHKDQLFDKMNI